MYANITSTSKKFLVALGVLALAASGQAAVAGDRGPDSANAYSRFGQLDDIALIDAVNRDHPVTYSRLNGSNGANPYLQYGDHDDLALIDAINSGNQQYLPSLPAASPEYRAMAEREETLLSRDREDGGRPRS